MNKKLSVTIFVLLVASVIATACGKTASAEPVEPILTEVPPLTLDGVRGRDAGWVFPDAQAKCENLPSWFNDFYHARAYPTVAFRSEVIFFDATSTTTRYMAYPIVYISGRVVSFQDISDPIVYSDDTGFQYGGGPAGSIELNPDPYIFRAKEFLAEELGTIFIETTWLYGRGHWYTEDIVCEFDN